MKKLFAGILIMFMLFVLCSCGGSKDVISNSSSADRTSSTEGSNAELLSGESVLPPSETFESISKKATNIMFAYCDQVLISENGKATFLFGVIEEYKDTEKFDFNKMNSIKVVGDIDKYDYKNTYAPENSYVLWLIYDEDKNVYEDIGIRILPLMERKPLSSIEVYEQFRQEIIDLNNARGGQIYDWMNDMR